MRPESSKESVAETHPSTPPREGRRARAATPGAPIAPRIFAAPAAGDDESTVRKSLLSAFEATEGRGPTAPGRH